MKEIHNLPEFLREIADRVEAHNATDYQLVLNDINICDALRRLEAILPNKGFKIGIDIWKHPGEGPTIAFTIWDGKKNHEGKKLGDVLNAVLLAYKPATAENAIEKLQEQITPMPF